MSLIAVAARWRGLMSVCARPKVRRWCGGALIFLALAGVLAYAAVPWVVRKVAVEQVQAQLGRQLSVGDIRFQPWALDLALKDLVLAGPTPAAPPLLKVAQVRVNLSVASLWRLAPVVESLQINGVNLKLTRTSAGHYDVDDILQRWRERPAEADAPPAHFALYNLSITGLQAELEDQPAGRTHRLEQGLLTLPFLSNQEDDLEVQVEPRLAFQLDGATFDTGAQAKPFSASREAVVKLSLRDVDVSPWLPYWPASVPVRPSQGHWSADVTLSFAQPPGKAASLTLGGRVEARDAAWTLTDGQPLLGWRSLSLGLGQVQPLLRQAALESLTIDGLQGSLKREPSGQLSLLKAFSPAKSPAQSTEVAPPAARSDWTVSLKHLALPQARLHWQDQSVRPAVNWQIQNIQLRGEQLRWPLPSELPALPLSLSGEWAPEGAAQAPATWQAEAFVGAQGGKVQLSLGAWPLAWWQPYQPAALKAQVQGQLGLSGSLQWTQGQGAAAPQQVEAQLSRLQIDRLQLSAPGHDAAVAVRQVSLEALGLTWPQQHVSVAKLLLDQPVVKAARSSHGELDLQAWWQPAPDAAAPAKAQGEPQAWQVKLGLLEWQGGQLTWRDAQAPREVDLTLSGWNTQWRHLQWPATQPWSLQGSARLAASGDPRRQAGGQMRWSGLMAPLPFSWSGKLEADRLPLHLLAPYVPGLPLDIQRAELTWRGQAAVSLAEAGPTWRAQGEATVTDFRAMAPGAGAATAGGVLGEPSDEELLSWQTLSLPDLDAQGEPGRPPQIKLGVVVLADAFARLVVTEEGRLNLTALAPPAAAASASKDAAALPPAVVASAASSPGRSEPAVRLSVAGVRLQNGRVDFSDRFIRPNYRADLTALNGQVGALSSPSQGPATLALQGRAAGTAALDIQGQIQPFTQPPSLDIQARATDLELAPLTPYAAKYAGYAIERGKLSLNVGYHVQPDGQLRAQNQLILNQLTFGERVESPDATRLPVALAVALLKDRNGVIDLHLPIEGSLNDPQFRIGPVVLKLVLNLLGKALTSPFSLLAGGGSDELSQVAFEPGTAQLSASARAGLDKVAQALQDRPSLSLTVHTALDLSAEQDALRGAALGQRLQAERRKELARAGDAVPQGELALSDTDRSRLLARLYADTRLPNKPRNALGLEKSVTTAEAETLLKAALAVGAEQMRELALQRGLAVRDALVAKGLPGERIFLAAPSAKVAGVGEGAVAASHVAGLTLGMP